MRNKCNSRGHAMNHVTGRKWDKKKDSFNINITLRRAPYLKLCICNEVNKLKEGFNRDLKFNLVFNKHQQGVRMHASPLQISQNIPLSRQRLSRVLTSIISNL